MLKNFINSILTLSLILYTFCGTKVLADTEHVLKMYLDLSFAAREGQLDQVEKLLQQGADPNWNKPPFSIVPLLHKPLDCRYLDSTKVAIMKMLLEAGANPNALSRRGDTALIELSHTGSFCDNTVETLEIAELLISYKADLKIKNKLGYTALSRAILAGKDSLSAFLAEHSDISEENIKMAMRGNMPNLLLYLINNGLDLTKYPLIDWAIWNGFDDVLIALLNRGVDSNKFLVKNKNYDFPVLYATRYQKNNAVKILYQYGSDITVQGRKGRTIQNLIDRMNNIELNDWLKSLKAMN
jgi:ankyrin repeat protein